MGRPLLVLLALVLLAPAGAALVPEDLVEHALGVPRLVLPVDDATSVGPLVEQQLRGSTAPASPSARPSSATAGPSAALDPGRDALLWMLAAGGGLGLGLGFRHVHRRNALDHPGRLAILDVVRRQPGLHLRAIARATGQRPQRAAYHLDLLERLGLLTSRSVGGRRCYQEPGVAPEVRRALLEASQLPSEAQRRVLALLATHPGLSQSEVARQLDMWPGQARWHLRRLADEGALVEQREGKALVYRPRLSTRPGP